MKNKQIIISSILIFIIFLLLFSFVSAKQVWVNSYTRKDGTVVEGYWRNSPDSQPNPTPQHDYTKTNKSAGTFKIINIKENITGNIYTALLTISEKEDNIVSSKEYFLKYFFIKNVGFSSVDDVMTAVAINNIGKVPNAPPFTIGSSIENVIRVMGTPESINTSFKSYKYRNSTIYFDDDWKVQSWDNRYGNLKVSLENENDDILDIGEYLIDAIFKITNDNLSEISKVLTTDKDAENIIKEFQEYLKNQ